MEKIKERILNYLLGQFTPEELLRKIGFRVGIDKGIVSKKVWVKLDIDKWHIAEWEIEDSINIYSSPIIHEKFNRLSKLKDNK